MRVATACLVSLAVLFSDITLAQEAAKNMAEYGVKTIFEKKKDILFPDFSLAYSGQRRVRSPVFKPGFVFHDFTVKRNSEETKISWSSGTGDISPHPFKVSGKEFYLELQLSEKLGKLKPNELVIWKKE